jgi:hypothetical protein
MLLMRKIVPDYKSGGRNLIFRKRLVNQKTTTMLC